MEKIIRFIITKPLYTILFAFLAYIFFLHIIPFWNDLIAQQCSFFLKINGNKVTDLFIPIFLVLIGTALFDKYKIYKELETDCHIVKSELEANEYLMAFFEKIINSNKYDFSKEFKKAKFCSFKCFHLDRFKIDMIHIKYDIDKKMDLENELNKCRSNLLQTVNVLNKWLVDKQNVTKKSVQVFFEDKFKRLRKENKELLHVMNKILRENRLKEMEMTIKNRKEF